MTMLSALFTLLLATVTNHDMRNTIHSTFGINDNVFAFTIHIPAGTRPPEMPLARRVPYIPPIIKVLHAAKRRSNCGELCTNWCHGRQRQGEVCRSRRDGREKGGVSHAVPGHPIKSGTSEVIPSRTSDARPAQRVQHFLHAASLNWRPALLGRVLRPTRR